MRDLTVLQAKRFGTYSCSFQNTLQEAARVIVEEDISGLVVLDGDGYLAGIITRSDLLRAYISRADWADQPVETYMSREVVTVLPTDHISRVARLLLDKQIHRVVIVQKEHDRLRPVGVISDSDLVYHLVKEV